MCENCWIERGGHSIVNKRTIKGSNLIADLYATEDGGAGGYAHVVVDDDNLEDRSIDFCLESAEKNEFKDDICQETRKASIKCLSYLKKLSFEERSSALAIYNGFVVYE